MHITVTDALHTYSSEWLLDYDFNYIANCNNSTTTIMFSAQFEQTNRHDDDNDNVIGVLHILRIFAVVFSRSEIIIRSNSRVSIDEAHPPRASSRRRHGLNIDVMIASIIPLAHITRSTKISIELWYFAMLIVALSTQLRDLIHVQPITIVPIRVLNEPVQLAFIYNGSATRAEAMEGAHMTMSIRRSLIRSEAVEAVGSAHAVARRLMPRPQRTIRV